MSHRPGARRWGWSGWATPGRPAAVRRVATGLAESLTTESLTTESLTTESLTPESLTAERQWANRPRRAAAVRPAAGPAVLDGVPGQLDERLLQRAGLRGQLVQGDPGRPGNVADLLDRCVQDLQRPVGVGDLHSGTQQRVTQPGEPRGSDPDRRPGGSGDEVGGRRVGDQPTAADDDQVVRGQRHLGQQVRGDEHGPALRGQVLHERADPVDALRVEPVDRLVEQQHLRVAQQGAGQAEPLLHAERELADRLAGDAGQPDQIAAPRPPGGPEILLDAAMNRRCDAGGPVRVHPVRVQQRAHLGERMMQCRVRLAVDQRLAAVRVVQAQD